MTRGPALLAPIFAAAALAAGCHFPISQEISYKKAGQEIPVKAEPVAKAAKKNDLVAGIRRLELTEAAKAQLADADDPREIGDVDVLGRQLAEELLAAKIFREVHYPLEDQAVDVILEGTLDLAIDKHHGLNFVKVLPGLLALLPWLDSVGLGYDHTLGLTLRVRDGQKPDAVCAVFDKRSELTVKRYPSVFFGVALHAGFFVLSVLEGFTTDIAVADGLAQRNAGLANREAIAWLTQEFEPTARACPNHPELKQGAAAKFCPVCKTNLRYPILNRTVKP
jgi:hypothetical protein